MQREINKRIPDAIQAIRDNLVSPENSINVDKEYKGYISSMGASLIQSGLMPTLSFYTDLTSRDDSPGGKRNKLLIALLQVMDYTAKQEGQNLMYVAMQKIHGSDTPDFSNRNTPIISFNHNFTVEKQVTREILYCAIALKLALRMFNNN